MKELIERLEKATGPDRELDREIWKFDDPINSDERHYNPYSQGGQSRWPHYTASIDAALTLVSIAADKATNWGVELDRGGGRCDGRSDWHRSCNNT